MKITMPLRALKATQPLSTLAIQVKGQEKDFQRLNAHAIHVAMPPRTMGEVGASAKGCSQWPVAINCHMQRMGYHGGIQHVEWGASNPRRGEGSVCLLLQWKGREVSRLATTISSCGST